MSAMEIETALNEYSNHDWDPTPQKCACGKFFEATRQGHKAHARHRMEETIKTLDKFRMGIMTPFGARSENCICDHYGPFLKVYPGTDGLRHSARCPAALGNQRGERE